MDRADLVIGHHLSRGDGTRDCSSRGSCSFVGAASRPTRIELSSAWRGRGEHRLFDPPANRRLAPSGSATVAQPAGAFSPGAMRVFRTRKGNLMPGFDAKVSDPLWMSVRQAPP